MSKEKPDLTNGGKLPWFRRERREAISDSRLTLWFTMLLSGFLIVASTIGAFLVMIDPKGTIVIGEHSIVIGGNGFAEQMKGAVLTLILIGGFTAVVTFWLRISNQEARAQEANTDIAKGAAPAAAAATDKALNLAAQRTPTLIQKKDGLPAESVAWVTAFEYKVGDQVTQNDTAYLCAVTHTSGVFDDDLASGKWTLKIPKAVA